MLISDVNSCDNLDCDTDTGYECVCDAGYEDEFCTTQQDPLNSMIIGWVCVVLIILLGYLVTRPHPTDHDTQESETNCDGDEEEGRITFLPPCLKRFGKRVPSLSLVQVASSLERFLLEDIYAYMQMWAITDRLRDLRSNERRA